MKKNFVIDPVFNPQNDRWIQFNEANSDDPDDTGDARNAADAASGKYLARSKHPASAMFLGAVASTGEVSPPIWFSMGFRLGSEDYIKALWSTLVTWMRKVAAAHGLTEGESAPFVFQQDSASAHSAKKTLQFLKGKGIKFWIPLQWPQTPQIWTHLIMRSGLWWPRGPARIGLPL